MALASDSDERSTEPWLSFTVFSHPRFRAESRCGSGEKAAVARVLSLLGAWSPQAWGALPRVLWGTRVLWLPLLGHLLRGVTVSCGPTRADGPRGQVDTGIVLLDPQRGGGVPATQGWGASILHGLGVPTSSQKH